MSEILLSISLLVSGREDTTEKCLNSIQPLMEALPCELILVDTGCDHELRTKLEKYTDKIIPFAWCDDFAKARNAGLKEAKGRWFLFLDDDEWFEDVSPIVNFFTSGEYEKYGQAVYKVRNYSDREGTQYSDDWVSRMIKLESDTCFEGKVHESLVPTRGKCKQIDAFVHHYGYAFATEEERQAHFKRNAELLKKLIAEEPDNMRWRLQLLQEYMSIGMGQEMEEEGRSSLLLVRNIDKPFVNLCRGAFCLAVLKGLYLQEKYEEVLEQAEKFRQGEKLVYAGECGIYYYGALAADRLENREAVKACSEAYCASYAAYCSETYDEQSRIIAESISFVNDIVQKKPYEAMLILWAESLALLGQESAFPEEKTQELAELIRGLMDGNGEFLSLPKELCVICEAGMVPYEDMILELPVSQWMAQVMVLESVNQPEKWQELREFLQNIKSREDIRYDYFAMHDAKQRIQHAPEEKTYEELNDDLIYFTESHLAYAKKIYTKEAFSGEMEMLPASCRAAVCTQNYFQEPQDWSAKLEWLKQAAKRDPSMGEFVKVLAREIGREQERQAEAAEDAARQLREMAKQVKEQVKLLMESGAYQDAYGIVQQLRQMVPEDKEVKRLETELKKQCS